MNYVILCLIVFVMLTGTSSKSSRREKMLPGREKRKAPSNCQRPRKHGVPGQMGDRPSAWLCGCSKVKPKSLKVLEMEDIAWRLENDPEWAEVFGGDYLPNGSRKPDSSKEES